MERRVSLRSGALETSASEVQARVVAGGPAGQRLFPLTDVDTHASLGAAVFCPGAFLWGTSEPVTRPRRQRRTLCGAGELAHLAPATRREPTPASGGVPPPPPPPSPKRPQAEHAPAGWPRRRESGWAGKGGEGRGRREGGRGRGASPRRGRALARAAGIARRRCGNVRHVGHGAGSGSGGRAADLVCGSGRGRRGAVFGRGGRPCCGRGQ